MSDTKSNHRRRTYNAGNNAANRNKRRNTVKSGGPRNKKRRPTNQTKKENEKVSLPPIGDKIRIIPIGGVEEIGKNMTVIEYRDEIVVVDVGIEFTDEEENPGIDYILPNTTYLEENKEKIKAVVITHGHLDHIGGLPYLIERIGNPPIYSCEFGSMLIKKRHEEFPHLPKLNLKVVKKGEKNVSVSKHLKVTFFGLTHSIPDSTGIIIETPYGDIINTGDVRVDNRKGVPTKKEEEQYAIFKDRNVLFMTMDSTGIPKPGWTISEEEILGNIDKIVSKVKGRIIIATFASQVERILEFIKMAQKYNKKLVVEGRSMKTNVEIIRHLGLADLSHMIPIGDIDDYKPDEVLVLATGAQGEEFAALMRISNRTHKNIRLNETDTVVLSSSIIPGNERAITKLKDNLYRHDAHIITYLDSEVHASGHGTRAELEWIHKQIPYKFFMPVHGHHYMLKMHAEMVESLGVPKENIVVPDNGSVIEISNEGKTIQKLKQTIPAGDMTVDGHKIGNIQEVVIRDRKMLSEDGMFVIIATVNTRSGKLKKSPDIISRGFVYLRESQELLQQTRLIIKRSVESNASKMNPIDFDTIKGTVEKEVSQFLFQKTAKSPVVIPVILGV